MVADGWLTSSWIKLRGGVFYPEVERETDIDIKLDGGLIT